MRHTIATKGDRLDQIVFAFYKNLDVLSDVMMANVHLLNKPILDNGDIVYLPEIALPTHREVGASLW